MGRQCVRIPASGWSCLPWRAASTTPRCTKPRRSGSTYLQVGLRLWACIGSVLGFESGSFGVAWFFLAWAVVVGLGFLGLGFRNGLTPPTAFNVIDSHTTCPPPLHTCDLLPPFHPHTLTHPSTPQSPRLPPRVGGGPGHVLHPR